MGKFLEFKTTDGGWEYVTRVNSRGAVIVLVYHKDIDKYLMVEQFRPPVNCRVLEWAAGLIDEGESPLEAAVRELYEETGVKADVEELIDLGRIFSGVGMTDEEINLYALEIDSSHEIGAGEVQGAEMEHGLITRWVTEDELTLVKAAKALSVYVRYLAKKKNPQIVFPD